ncbi:hypothetical protein Glove_9g367 [Diversispora epigaea]|uniref:Uncharacterized protein n=1 Tax=Diversispora epigaea TaxID=1348612 RepID=A0A397JUS7_9GLOM|nr:hypothetical protein Glove_9g367 [Diversispora epigaea]
MFENSFVTQSGSTVYLKGASKIQKTYDVSVETLQRWESSGHLIENDSSITVFGDNQQTQTTQKPRSVDLQQHYLEYEIDWIVLLEQIHTGEIKEVECF